MLSIFGEYFLRQSRRKDVASKQTDDQILDWMRNMVTSTGRTSSFYLADSVKVKVGKPQFLSRLIWSINGIVSPSRKK